MEIKDTVIEDAVQQPKQVNNAEHGRINQVTRVRLLHQNIQMEDLKAVIIIVEIQMTILLYGVIRLIKFHQKKCAMELSISYGKRKNIVLHPVFA